MQTIRFSGAPAPAHPRFGARRDTSDNLQRPSTYTYTDPLGKTVDQHGNPVSDGRQSGMRRLRALGPIAALLAAVGIPAAEAEKHLILRTLEHVDQNKAEAARRLGLDVKTIRNKLKAYREALE